MINPYKTEETHYTYSFFCMNKETGKFSIERKLIVVPRNTKNVGDIPSIVMEESDETGCISSVEVCMDNTAGLVLACACETLAMLGVMERVG